MAVVDPFSQVYQGREGTGAAFVLSGNKAADIFNNRVSQLEQRRRLEALQRQKAEQAQATLINKNLSKVNLADHWVAHDKELQDDYKTLMNEAAVLKSQGIDPTSNSEWKSKYSSLDSKAKYSGKLYSGMNELMKEINANPDKYSAESIAEAKAYFDPNKPLSEYIKDGNVPPQLKLRYNESDILKGISPGADIKNDGNYKITGVNRKGIFDQLRAKIDSPEGQFFLSNKYGVNPSIGLFGEPDKNGLYPTDDASVVNIANEILQTPGIENKLSEIGISGDPEEIQNKIIGLIKQQNTGGNAALNAWADAVEGKANKGKEKVNTNFSRWIQQSNLELRKMANARAEKNHDEKNKSSASFNIQGNVAIPGIGVKPTTIPLEIDAGDIKGSVVPKEVFSTSTGRFGANTNARNIKNAKIRLMPFTSFKDDKGRLHQRMLSEEDIQSGKYNPEYRYMVYGTERVKDSYGEEKDMPVAFDASNLSSDKFDKKVDFDKYEVKLPADIQVKILFDRIGKINPSLSKEDKMKLATEYYNERLNNQ